MVLKKAFCILIFLLITAASMIYAENSIIRAEVYENEYGLRNVYIITDNKIINITKFKNPHHIYRVEISTSQKWLLVVHMDYKPLKLSVYNLSTFKLLGQIEPGHGGHFYWTASDSLLHYWGCGTNCAIYRLYDHNLNTLLTNGTTGISLSPLRDKMITFPSTAASDENIVVHYFNNLHTKHKLSIPGLMAVSRIVWVDKITVTIEYYHKNDKRLQITKQLPAE